MDVCNGMYNPFGKTSAAHYRFPDIGTFDVILLKSVFTHMMKDDVENYLAQLPGLLKNGGKCVATFFLLNENQQRLAQEGKNTTLFHPHDDTIAFAKPDVPESIVAFDERQLLQMIRNSGLKVTATQYGTWSGNMSGTSHQDILILQNQH